jgi:hypothetical protein
MARAAFRGEFLVTLSAERRLQLPHIFRADACALSGTRSRVFFPQSLGFVILQPVAPLPVITLLLLLDGQELNGWFAGREADLKHHGRCCMNEDGILQLPASVPRPRDGLLTEAQLVGRLSYLSLHYLGDTAEPVALDPHAWIEETVALFDPQARLPRE